MIGIIEMYRAAKDRADTDETISKLAKQHEATYGAAKIREILLQFFPKNKVDMILPEQTPAPPPK